MIPAEGFIFHYRKSCCQNLNIDLVRKIKELWWAMYIEVSRYIRWLLEVKETLFHTLGIQICYRIWFENSKSSYHFQTLAA